MAGSSILTVILPIPEQRRHLHVGEDHHADADDRRDREDDQLGPDESGQHQPPPRSAPCRRGRSRSGRRGGPGEIGSRQRSSVVVHCRATGMPGIVICCGGTTGRIGPVDRRHRSMSASADRMRRPPAASPRGGSVDGGLQRVVGVVQIPRITRRRNQFRVLFTPSGTQEQRALEPRDREVDDGEQVHVVTADRPVDEALAVREGRQRSANASGRSGPMSASALNAGSRFLRSVTRSAVRVVDQSRRGVAERAELRQRGGDPRPLLDQHVHRRRYILMQRSMTRVRWPAKVPASRFSSWMDATMLSRCRSSDADEAVQPRQQIPDIGFAAGQRGAEVVDDVADLPESTAVDNSRQRRQRLLGGRIGRRLVQRDRRARLQLPGRLLADRWVERQVHRSQQAGLPDGGHRVGRHHHVRFDRHLDVGVPVPARSSCRRCRPRRRRSSPANSIPA